MFIAKFNSSIEMLLLGKTHTHIFCSSLLIVVDLGYEWHFMLSSLKFLQEKNV